MAAKKRLFEPAFHVYTCISCNMSLDVMYLSSCGCFYCDPCIQTSPDNCSSCSMNLDKENMVLLRKQKPCKYQDQGCTYGAKFICKCIKDGFLCASCLMDLHDRRVDKPCSPEKIKTNSSQADVCDDCKIFISGYKVPDEDKKVCIDCRTNYKNLEKIIDNDTFDHQKITKDIEITKKILQCKRKRITSLLENRKNMMKAESNKIDEAIQKIKSDFLLYKQDLERELHEIVSHHDKIFKIEKFFASDGPVSRILGATSMNLIQIEGGHEKLSSLFKILRDQEIPSCKNEKVKFDFMRSENMNQYIVSFSTKEPLNFEASSSQFNTGGNDVSVLGSRKISRSRTPIKASQQILDIQLQDYLSQDDKSSPVPLTLESLKTNDPVCIQVTRIMSPFYICIEIPELVKTREEILETLLAKADEWTKLTNFAYKDIVICSDNRAAVNKLKRGKIKYIDRLNKQVRVYLLDFGFDILLPFINIGTIPSMEYKKPPATCFIGKLMNIMPLSKFVFPENSCLSPTDFISELAKKSDNWVTLTRYYKYHDIIFCRINQDEDWSELLINNKMAQEYKENNGCFVPTRDYCYKYHGRDDCKGTCHRVHDCPFCEGNHSLISCPEHKKRLEIMSQ